MATSGLLARGKIPINSEWLQSYVELQRYDNNTKAALQRIGLLMDMLMHTRMDTMNYFTNSFRTFLEPTSLPANPARPYGRVVASIVISFQGSPGAAVWNGTPTVQISDGQAVLAIPAAAAPTLTSTWTSTVASPAGAAQIGAVALPPAHLTGAGERGPIGWQSIQVARGAPPGAAAWAPGMIAPREAVVTVTYTILNAQAVGTPAWVAGTAFVFTATLKFKRSTMSDFWAATFGKNSSVDGSADNDAVWSRPL